MKGDYTRDTFRPEKHYSAVRQQQGRIQLDADWNEQADICARRDQTIARDLIGPCGAPKAASGFAVSWVEDGDLRLSAGRLYVAGMLCELDEESSYLEQPDLPHPAAIAPAEGGRALVYIDVWQRLITAVEDPEIREPALGGPDTATRAKTVWQVKVLTDVGVPRCEEPIAGWPPVASDVRLAVTLEGTAAVEGEKTEVSTANGFAFLENALYRVEIHEPGPMGAATFKWSRENASVAVPVTGVLPASANGHTGVSVERFGRDRALVLEEGDWVEALGDETELMQAPGTMARVERVDEVQQIVWLDRDLSSHANESHLKIRRWEGGEALSVTEGTIELEEGVKIQFSGGSFAAGDYWMFPVRETQPAVEWPAAPPHGVRHDYGKLALITWRKDGRRGWTCEVTDCRPLFGALAEGRGGGCSRCQAEITELRASLEQQGHQLRALQARLA